MSCDLLLEPLLPSHYPSNRFHMPRARAMLCAPKLGSNTTLMPEIADSACTALDSTLHSKNTRWTGRAMAHQPCPGAARTKRGKVRLAGSIAPHASSHDDIHTFLFLRRPAALSRPRSGDIRASHSTQHNSPWCFLQLLIKHTPLGLGHLDGIE